MNAKFPNPAGRACVNCRFFQLLDDGVLDGQCRHDPPQVVDKMEPYAVWPEVRPVDWCGQFAIKE